MLDACQGAARAVLERAGVRRDDVVLDFGCGVGTYSIPAAALVGPGGRVYALDRNPAALDELMREAESAGLSNVCRLAPAAGAPISLPAASVDVVLLYDVMHRYYFPQREGRTELFRHIYRVARPGALLSVFPSHADVEETEAEIEGAGFCLESRYAGTVVHNGRPAHGQVLNFRKPPGEAQAGSATPGPT